MNQMLALAERNVPRYTSYPTAPHFSATVGPPTYAAWLAELPDSATLSLYLHVPYCKELSASTAAAPPRPCADRRPSISMRSV